MHSQWNGHTVQIIILTEPNMLFIYKHYTAIIRLLTKLITRWSTAFHIHFGLSIMIHNMQRHCVSPCPLYRNTWKICCHQSIMFAPFFPLVILHLYFTEGFYSIQCLLFTSEDTVWFSLASITGHARSICHSRAGFRSSLMHWSRLDRMIDRPHWSNSTREAEAADEPASASHI